MSSLKSELEKLNINFSDQWEAGPSYLFPDGSFLNIIIFKKSNTSINHEYADSFINSHNLIEESLKDELLQKELNNLDKKLHFKERILKHTDNACVLQSGDELAWEWPYVDLPLEPLTNAQYEKLTEYIDWLHYNSPKRRFDVSLDIDLLEFDLDKDSTDSIIKEIKKLYNQVK